MILNERKCFTSGEDIEDSPFLAALVDSAAWENFLKEKIEKQHLRKTEEEKIRCFISEQRYLRVASQILASMESEKNRHCEKITGNGVMPGGNFFPGEVPKKMIVNKEGTTKKRVVYSYGEDVTITLKFAAHYLNSMEDLLAENCYAFRKSLGVRDALRRIRNNHPAGTRYCYKADISNYFNTINTEKMIERLAPVRCRDGVLYHVLVNILQREEVVEKGCIIREQHGVMAGIPVAPFLANLYLRDLDAEYEERGVEYYRYSDDVLFITDTEEEIQALAEEFRKRLSEEELCINESKECFFVPGEAVEFLGFAYRNGKVDLSDNTKRKIKAKIKRKAEALRRWQREKKLMPDKAAIGFIRAMNRKIYGTGGEDEFTWERWFLPNLTTDTGLKEIDTYMQEYVRYTVTGRHYKGNYRISYEQMKAWGYRSMVNVFYKKRKQSI